MLFEEWLPSFERTTTGMRLRGKALQEWSLLGAVDKTVYKNATTVLKIG